MHMYQIHDITKQGQTRLQKTNKNKTKQNKQTNKQTVKLSSGGALPVHVAID